MAAIITEEFRRRTAQLFLSEVRQEINVVDGKGINYYVGIGKSDSWVDDENTAFTVPIPKGTPNNQREILSNLTTLIKILPKDSGLVIPNVKYKTDSYYKVYNPSDDSCFFPDLLPGGYTQNPCYTVNNNRIYLCLAAGPNGTSVSTQSPTSSTWGAPVIRLSDGYVWALLDELDEEYINDIYSNVVNSDQFITVSRYDDKAQNTQIFTASTNATSGLLYGFSIINGGTGYNTGSTVPSTINFIAHKEDGSVVPIPCPITYATDTGEILSVKLPNDWDYAAESSKKFINGYFDYEQYPTTASGAVMVANIAPVGGFYVNSAKILPTWYISICVSAKDSISGDGLYIPYRQISVIRDVEYNDELITDRENPATLRASDYIVLANETAPSNLINGDILTFENGTKVIFDVFASVDDQPRIHFHQNDKVGYGKIPTESPTGNVSFTRGGAQTNIPYTNISESREYNKGSGEVVFTESRSKIERSASQTEEIKIIIQF